MHNQHLTKLQKRYLELVKRSVGDFLYDFDEKYTQQNQTGFLHVDSQTGARRQITDYHELKENGLIASNVAHSLIGMKRLNQIQNAVETVLKEDIAGDFIETGVLRGGACIFMRALLEAYNDTERTVWVADSFEGFPEHGTGRREPTDTAQRGSWQATLEEVQNIFARYGLLDNQVQFLAGWFCDTLPQAPIEKLAILRLDGDLYVSTRDALNALYHKVSPGGFIIVDDYYAFEECRLAIREFRKAHKITEPLQRVDPVCVYWRKPL